MRGATQTISDSSVPVAIWRGIERGAWRARGPSFGAGGHTPRHDGRNAFTLIELMLAISIAAIIMAIGLPAFVHAMRKDDLRKAVSDVVEGCSHARAQAILRGVPMEFVIRAEDGGLSVRPAQIRSSTGSMGNAAFNGGASETRTSAPGFASQLPSDVGIKFLDVNFQDQMEFAESRVRFFPNGTSDEFTVILFSTKGEKKISLDLITGLADVETLR